MTGIGIETLVQIVSSFSIRHYFLYETFSEEYLHVTLESHCTENFKIYQLKSLLINFIKHLYMKKVRTEMIHNWEYRGETAPLVLLK